VAFDQLESRGHQQARAIVRAPLPSSRVVWQSLSTLHPPSIPS
jgi:hypothetical protein